LELFTPGSHGSTFGGNPFACAIAREALRVLSDEGLIDRSRSAGTLLLSKLTALRAPLIQAIRGKGLFVGLDIDPLYGPAKKLCKALKAAGLLCKDTRKQTVRLAPPLIIEQQDLEWAIAKIAEVLDSETKRH
jgi:ornithine--oxo-acid transaminase